MKKIGGDILEITWHHPTLGSGVIIPLRYKKKYIKLTKLQKVINKYLTYKKKK